MEGNSSTRPPPLATSTTTCLCLPGVIERGRLHRQGRTDGRFPRAPAQISPGVWVEREVCPEHRESRPAESCPGQRGTWRASFHSVASRGWPSPARQPNAQHSLDGSRLFKHIPLPEDLSSAGKLPPLLQWLACQHLPVPPALGTLPRARSIVLC